MQAHQRDGNHVPDTPPRSAPAPPLRYTLSSTAVPHLFLSLTLLTYVLSLGMYTRYLYTGSKLAGRLGTVFLGLGLIAHYFALLERSPVLNTVPYHDLYGSMSLFGWLLALTHLALAFYHRQRSVGA